MPTPSALEICRTDLFTREAELQECYPQVIVDKVLRIREMYNWFISNPDGTDAFSPIRSKLVLGEPSGKPITWSILSTSVVKNFHSIMRLPFHHPASYNVRVIVAP